MNNSFRIDLQVHPFKGVPLWTILKTMERKNIDAVALLYYLWNPKTSLALVRDVEQKTKERYKYQWFSNNMVFFTNRETGKVLLIILGQEVRTFDKEWHFLSVGATGIESLILEDIIEEILDRRALPIFDHPYANPRNLFRDLPAEKAVKLLEICRKYKKKIGLEWNGYCLPILRNSLKPLSYSNVNEKTELLAKVFKMPCLPTSDTHLRKESLADGIGTCDIKIPRKDMDFNNPLRSLIKNIFSFNFEAKKGYVSVSHLAEAFVLPMFFSKFRKHFITNLQ